MKQREFWVDPTPFFSTTKGFYAKHEAFGVKMLEPKDLIHVREVNPAQDEAIQKMVEALNKIPNSMRMEDLARAWSTLAPDRQAQHFYEGMLHMRSYLLEALEAWRKANE